MPTATRTPDSKKSSIGGVPAPVRMFPRGHVTSVAPSAASRFSSAATELHAVHDEHAIVEKAHAIEILDRTASRSAPTTDPTSPSARGLCGTGPCRISGTRSPRPTRRGARSTCANGSRCSAARIRPNSAGDTEYGACGASVWRTRSDAGSFCEARASPPASALAASSLRNPSSSWNTTAAMPCSVNGRDVASVFVMSPTSGRAERARLANRVVDGRGNGVAVLRRTRSSAR